MLIFIIYCSLLLKRTVSLLQISQNPPWRYYLPWIGCRLYLWNLKVNGQVEFNYWMYLTVDWFIACVSGSYCYLFDEMLILFQPYCTVADAEGAQQAQRPLKLDRLYVFKSNFVSECLKIRLRYHGERAVINPSASMALKRALDPYRKGLRFSCAPPPPSMKILDPPLLHSLKKVLWLSHRWNRERFSKWF